MKLRRKWVRMLVTVTTIFAVCVSCVSPAFASIFGSDEDLSDYCRRYGWSQRLIETGDSFTYTYDGEEHEIERASQYTLNYYNNLVTTTKQYLGIVENRGGADIAAVARAEVGASGSIESPPYSNNVKYNTWYYGHAVSGSSYPWCCVFVEWCANQCGYIESGLFMRTAGCTPLYYYFINNQGFAHYSMRNCAAYTGRGYMPVPGDIMFFWDGSVMEHIGIIVEAGDGYVSVVEGNTTGFGSIPGGGVAENKYTWAALNSRRSALNAQIVHVEYPVTDGQQGIYSFLTGTMGLNAAAACGVLANMDVETGGTFESDTVEIGFGEGYGLCQWTGSRRTDLINWCQANHYDYTTTEGQMWFLYYDLRTTYTYAWSQLRSVPNTASGAYQAGYVFGKWYEGGGTFQTAEEYGRVRGAISQNQYWPKYGN